MQTKDILLTLLVGESNQKEATLKSIEWLQQLANDFADEIALWNEEDPLDEIEAKYRPAFQEKAEDVLKELEGLDETQEKEGMLTLANDALQWKLLQYDDSVLSILLGGTLPENIADERFNILVRRYPEWALALAESMEEEECQCGCCHDDHHGEHHCHCHHE